MRILLVSQYPFNPAQHGGQKRVRALAEEYGRRHELRHMGVFWPGSYQAHKSDNSTNLVIKDAGLLEAKNRKPEMQEVLLSTSLTRDRSLNQKVTKIIQQYKPHIIHIEQPYLVSEIRLITNRLELPTVIIHGSQNVEGLLKRGIYKTSLDKARFKELINATTEIEKRAVCDADINLAVSYSDIAALRTANRERWWLVGNGTDYKPPATPLSLLNGGAGLSRIVFIGSAHPPNYKGVEALLSDTRFLEGRATLQVVGGAGEYLRSQYDQNSLFWRGKKAIGKVNEDKLRLYLEQADIIVLPIQIGGGSNLKTAEAISTGKKVVATSFAFRGFEAYMSLPGIYIGDSKSAFKAVLREALGAPAPRYTFRHKRIIRQLQWQFVLRPLRGVLLYGRIVYLYKLVKSTRPLS